MNFKFLTYFQISGSNLQYEGDDNLIDRSFGFLDQENYSPTYHGMRPQMFNCRSEPAIPPRLNMEALSQVKSINFQLSVRPYNTAQAEHGGSVSGKFNKLLIVGPSLQYRPG